MPFGNPVVGGTVLIRPAIKSPNFVSGVSGWSINKDGTIEANSVTLRGSGTSTAVEVGTAPNPQVQIASNANAGSIRFPTNRAIEANKSTIISGPVNTGLPNEYAALVITGPSVTGAGDFLRQQFSSQNNDGTSDANVQWIVLPANVSLMSLDKTIGLTLRSDLSVIGVSTAAGHRYADVNSPPATDPTAILLGLLNNNSNRFQVLATGKTDIANTDPTVPGLSVNHPVGQAGHLLDLNINSVNKFAVDANGAISTYAPYSDFIPSVNGGGTATFTTQIGWFQRVGKMVHFGAYLVVNAAGSGTAAVTVDVPTNIYRVTRQVFAAHVSTSAAIGTGEYSALCFTSGIGATIDRLTRNGANLTGADLTAGALITITGTYREA